MLLKAVSEQGVQVQWGVRFEMVVEETAVGEEGGGVVIETSRESGDGPSAERVRKRCVADVLVGADGIHSTVRKYIAPDCESEYTGTTGVLAHIPWDSVRWPEVVDDGGAGDVQEVGRRHAYERQCTLQGVEGAMFWIPEDREGRVVMIGKVCAL